MALLISRRKLRLLAAFVVAALLLVFPIQSMAQDGGKLKLQEQTIKAGLVYNFLKYTTWPGEPAQNDHLRVCLFGDNALDGNLSPLEGRTAQQSVINISRIETVGQTETCNVVFVSSDKKNALPELLAFLKGKHVLTVSDMDQFSSLGGMVELTMEDKRVALYINKKAVDQAGLSIQSRLLKLAKRISG